MWDSAGIVIRGVLTQALKKHDQGPYASGSEPGEADCEFVMALLNKGESSVHLASHGRGGKSCFPLFGRLCTKIEYEASMKRHNTDILRLQTTSLRGSPAWLPTQASSPVLQLRSLCPSCRKRRAVTTLTLSLPSTGSESSIAV